MPRSRAQGLGIWLLLYQVFGVIGVDNIPPATLLIAGLQILIFLRIIPVPWSSPADVCISVNSVWHQKQWLRLVLGAVEHGSDLHLYYNMVSFIWKGISLERRFGSARFAYLISVFTLLCSATLVGLCKLASEFSGGYYYHQCAVGFSSVLFALKVLTTHYWPHGTQYFMGLPIQIPVKYFVWVELLFIQVLVPNASFLGHLAGILVGLAYIHTPLGFLIDSIWNGIQPGRTYRFYSNNHLGREYHQRHFGPEGMTEEEQFEFARQESLRTHYGRNRQDFQRTRSTNNYQRPSAPYPEEYNYPTRGSNLPYPEEDTMPPTYTNMGRPSLYPDLNELRNQRLHRFQ